jgi:hypothetical protein
VVVWAETSRQKKKHISLGEEVFSSFPFSVHLGIVAFGERWVAIIVFYCEERFGGFMVHWPLLFMEKKKYWSCWDCIISSSLLSLCGR